VGPHHFVLGGRGQAFGQAGPSGGGGEPIKGKGGGDRKGEGRHRAQTSDAWGRGRLKSSKSKNALPKEEKERKGYNKEGKVVGVGNSERVRHAGRKHDTPLGNGSGKKKKGEKRGSEKKTNSTFEGGGKRRSGDQNQLRDRGLRR